ncbi:MAG: metallophosphoesterase [Oscillospiraceae bacterium]|nr:metallophosphoesterase [Oscillospiraceae bacterium]
MEELNNETEEIIKSFLVPFLKKIKKNGIKLSVEKILPGFNVNNFLIEKVRRALKFKKKLNLGRLGYVNIYYSGEIILEPVGLACLAVKNIAVTDEKILAVFDDILNQIEFNFLYDETYLSNKINKVLSNLNKTEFYSFGTSEERTLYDFFVFILIRYYKHTNKESPNWFKNIVKNISRKEFARDCLNFFSENSFKAFEKISENIYFDYKVAFDSWILRFFLNKKTNRGQISKLLNLFKLDLRANVEKFIKKYTGESFLNGLGEMLLAMVDALICGVSDDCLNIPKNYFNFTMTFGENEFSRRFRWFGIKDHEEFVEISENKNFNDCIIVRAEKEPVILARPTILNFGTVAKYKIEHKFKYSAAIKNLKEDTNYYFKIKRAGKNYLNNFKTCKKNNFFDFLIFSDSQGMLESDYKLFKTVLEKSFETFPDAEFLVHLGDFVDDGNNENYWDFILDSKIWGSSAVLPMAGNHETKFNPPLKFAGVKNSILTHFNLDFKNNENIIYYYFEYKNALFLVLDTNNPDGLGKSQIMWARQILKRSKMKWKIILTHKNAYSNGPHCLDHDMRTSASEIAELAAIGGVCLIVGGHEHVYSRSAPMCMGKPTNEEKKIENKLEIFENPDGAIFVTMGTSGVKNYKIAKKPLHKNDVVIDLNVPMFARIEIEENYLKFTAFKYESDNFKTIDEFWIKKNEEIEFNSNSVIKKIENLPDYPFVSFSTKINQIIDIYKKLSTNEKLKVNNLSRFNRICGNDFSLNEILSSDIAIVCSFSEFMSAISNNSIRIIIINCQEIKFGNSFGFKRKIKIERNLMIRGNAKLSFVSFLVKKNTILIINGTIRVDNNRNIFSIFPAIHTFEMHQNSVLVLSGNTNFENNFGIGKKSCIKVIGNNVYVYLKGNNFIKIPKKFTTGKQANVILDIV